MGNICLNLNQRPYSICLLSVWLLLTERSIYFEYGYSQTILWLSYVQIYVDSLIQKFFIFIYICINNFLGFIWEEPFFFFLWQFNVFSWPFNKFEKLWNYLSSDTKPISRAPWHRKFQKKFTNYCCWDPGWMWEFWTK